MLLKISMPRGLHPAHISMPVSTFEDQVQHSRSWSLYQSYDNPRYLDLNGQTITTVNLDGFVLQSFEDVIDGIYDNSHDNADFIYEVWYVVSQMTVYDEDISAESEERYALETFTRTGGDCEDLVILVADMLMSSSHTDTWTFEYVYMDLDNPNNAQEVNHVILAIDDGQYSYLIEATASPDYDYFPNGVRGWFFEVV